MNLAPGHLPFTPLLPLGVPRHVDDIADPRLHRAPPEGRAASYPGVLQRERPTTKEPLRLRELEGYGPIYVVRTGDILRRGLEAIARGYR